MKKVYFVRHGESEANLKRIVAGGEFESPLTPKGKKQAVKAGHALKNKGIEAIVSSPMGRTRDTATIIAKEIGYDPKKILYDKNFVEVFNGFYSGKSYDLRNKHIEKGILVDDIEAPDRVYSRVKAGLEEIKKLPAKTIVLVSHGATGRMLRAIVENLPHHDFMGHQRFENTEIYEFELE